MRVVADTNGAYSITGDIDYLRFTFDNSQFVVAGSPTTIPVHIDFDQLAGVPIPNGTVINNQANKCTDGPTDRLSRFKAVET
jgi:hypothetical protein